MNAQNIMKNGGVNSHNTAQQRSNSFVDSKIYMQNSGCTLLTANFNLSVSNTGGIQTNSHINTHGNLR